MPRFEEYYFKVTAKLNDNGGDLLSVLRWISLAVG
jgi:hypothetical protein